MNFKYILTVILFSLLIVSCKKEVDDTTDPIITPTPTPADSIPAGLIKIGETYVNGSAAKAVVYSYKQLQTGYNKLYIALYDSVTNARLNDGHVDLDAEMEMNSITHRAPSENTEETSHSDKLWKAALYFTMPDSNSSWHIHVGFHNHKNDLEGEGDFTVSSVFNATYPLLTSFTDSTLNGHTIYLSMLNPLNCKVGVNDFEFVAHEQFRPDSLVPRDDYQVTMTPVMVSMGHSSPNNVQPVNIGAGHYNGDVVFTMSGKWRILLLLKRNNVSVKDSAYFDVEF